MKKKTVRTEPVSQPFVVRRSGISGRGGFAVRQINKGEKIIEYEGERITQSEGDRRYDDKPHTYLFEVSSRTLIDGAVDGNDARFINHSCRPNCESVLQRGRIHIHALRRIQTGEELTFDYALPRDKTLGAAEDEIYPCRCGARACRGTILEPMRRRRRRRKRKSQRG
jgi:SET domain-containing protein